MSTDTASTQPRFTWWQYGLLGLVALVMILLAGFWAVGGFRFLANMRGPEAPFNQTTPPPKPDFAQSQSWLALPGRTGLERTTLAGVTPIDEATAPADVFFVHPTTFEGNSVWNAPFDATAAQAPLNDTVLLGQASVFNACCRIFAPRYRQATLGALSTPAAMNIAYSDVASAFEYFLAQHNQGRPFIIAAHSQGTAHAIRLLQEYVLDRPAQTQLVAAYLIGGYVPDTFGEIGLPICNDALGAGCVMSFNASQQGRSGARIIVDDRRYWWKDALETDGPSEAICVNPLNWSRDEAALADTNLGSLPWRRAPFAQVPEALDDLVVGLTGAVCRNALLVVNVPWNAPFGFNTLLTFLTGSFHLNEYELFYEALQRNAVERVEAFTSIEG